MKWTDITRSCEQAYVRAYESHSLKQIYDVQNLGTDNMMLLFTNVPFVS